MSMIAAPAPEVIMAIRCGNGGSGFLYRASKSPSGESPLELFKRDI